MPPTIAQIVVKIITGTQEAPIFSVKLLPEIHLSKITIFTSKTRDFKTNRKGCVIRKPESKCSEKSCILIGQSRCLYSADSYIINNREKNKWPWHGLNFQVLEFEFV